MDNFIEESINYLFYNGGFDLNTGYQKFEFRIRPNGKIEVNSSNNHIKTTYTGEPDIYQFFSFLIFCDLFSSVQKSTISLCKDKNVSRNNLKALNRVYVIYKNMLSLDGKMLADAICDDDPGALDRIMLEKSYDKIPCEVSNLKYEIIKARIETYAYNFARRFEYYDHLYDLMLATEDYDAINEYAQVKWEELNNNIEVEHPNYFSKVETREILFSMVNKFESELEIKFTENEEEKHFVLNTLLRLYDYGVDILDIIYYINWAFTLSSQDDKDIVTLEEVLTVLELSYLDDNIRNELISKLNNGNKKNKKNYDTQVIVFKKRN